MAEDGVVFTDRAAARVADATRWVEQERQRLFQQPGPAAETTAEFSFARVTGTVDASGNYPAIVTAYDPTDGTFNDYGAVRLRPANGESLTSGVRYACRAVGKKGTDLLYMVGAISGAAATPFSGAGVHGSTASTLSSGVSTTLSWSVEDFDTDNYFSASDRTKFFVPSTGFYAISASVVVSQSVNTV